MKAAIASTPKCYLDCYYFSKCNMAFFLILLLTQMLQSMGFNCFFNLPMLFMILLFLPWFSFRKKVFVAYSYYLLFFVSFCTLSVYVKIMYAIFVHTESYLIWYEKNQNTTTVKIFGACFGQRMDLQDMKPASLNKWIYWIAIHTSFVFSNAWLIAKWSTVRE